MARFETERPFFAKPAEHAPVLFALEANHPLFDLTEQKTAALDLSPTGEGSLAAGSAHLLPTLLVQHTRAKEQRGIPLLCAGAIMLRFAEGERRINAPALLIPVHAAQNPSQIALQFEETEPNGPLFDLLQQEFGFFVDWPANLREGPEGLKAAFSTLKNAARPGWGVYDEVVLGLFDRSTWQIHADATARASQIAQHPLAGSLSGGRLGFVPGQIPEEAGEEEPLALPLPADSAQRRALRAVAAGNSLILSGPTGSGKITTAANAALHALFSGKTVLFAAAEEERRAAFLNLLENNGAQSFCLNLLAEANPIPNAPPEEFSPPRQFSASARRLVHLRKQCNALAHPATVVRSCGMRFYEIAEACAAFADAPDVVHFSQQEVAPLRRDSFAHLQDLCGQLVRSGQAVGHPANNPLAEIRRKHDSKKVGEEVPPLLSAGLDAARQANEAAALLCAQWNLPKPAARREFEQLCAMAEAAARWEDLPHQWLEAEDMAAFLAKVRELVSRGKRISETRARLLCTVAEPALAADVEGMAARWAEAEKSLVSRATAQGKLFKEITTMLRHGAKLERKQVPATLAAIAAYQKDVATLQRMLPELGGLLGSFWKDVYTDWFKVEGHCRIAQSVDDELTQSLGSREACAALYRRAAESGNLSAARQFAESWRELERVRDGLFALLDVADAFDDHGQPYALILEEAFTRWNGAKDGLKDWMNWRLDREKAMDAGLSGVVAAYENGLDHEAVLPAFLRGISLALARYSVESDPKLARFSAQTANNLLDELCRFDEQVRREAASAISAACAKNAPQTDRQAQPYSEQGMFQKALAQPNPSLIRMFERMPGLMPKRFPAVVASSAEAARLPADTAFDLVIVDGEDAAAGLLSRGKTCLVIDRGQGESSPAEKLRAQGLPEVSLNAPYAGLDWSGIVQKSIRHTPSAVFSDLAQALSQAGWSCRHADGLDLLVMDQNRPVSPLFGVVADGAGTRDRPLSDRELFFTRILRKDGCKVVPFWYAQWWNDRAGVINELTELAEATQRKADEKAAQKKRFLAEKAGKQGEVAEKEAVSVVFQEESPGLAKEMEMAPPLEDSSKFLPEGSTGLSEEASSEAFRSEIKSRQPQEPVPIPPRPNGAFIQRDYAPAQLDPQPMAGESLFDPGCTLLFKSKLAEAVAQEGPVAKSLLVRRVLSACGIPRAGAKMAKALGDLAEQLDLPATREPETGETFFWSEDEPPERFCAFRTACPGAFRRDAAEIPREEAANAICAAMEGCGAMQDIQIAREAAYLMGFSRLGTALEQAMLRGVAHACARGDIETADGARYRLVTRDFSRE